MARRWLFYIGFVGKMREQNLVCWLRGKSISGGCKADMVKSSQRERERETCGESVTT